MYNSQNGSTSSVSDITTAAGWKILNCTTSTNSQTIQLICADESKGCEHLFQQGAEHTIVRLPEDVRAFIRSRGRAYMLNLVVWSGTVRSGGKALDASEPGPSYH